MTMNKLPPEEIDGKLYQPVKAVSCGDCAFLEQLRLCLSLDCCTPNNREDKLNVCFIEIEDEE